jgi:hypothetical protein
MLIGIHNTQSQMQMHEGKRGEKDEKETRKVRDCLGKRTRTGPNQVEVEP